MKTLAKPADLSRFHHRCEDYTHEDPECPDTAGNIRQCNWETRAPMACFTCFDVTPYRNGQTQTFGNDHGTGPSTSPSKPAPTVDPWDQKQTAEWIQALGRKLVTEDIANNPEAKPAIQAWLDAYTGDFSYLTDMQAKTRHTDGMLKGVANCWRADMYRNPPAETEISDPATPIVTIPEGFNPGRYMTADGSRIKIDIPTKGKWAGWVFVKGGSEYGFDGRLGSIKPGGGYKGTRAAQVVEIVADPKAAAVRYGQNTGSCGKCGRVLEDEESVKRGIGPVCARSF